VRSDRRQLQPSGDLLSVSVTVTVRLHTSSALRKCTKGMNAVLVSPVRALGYVVRKLATPVSGVVGSTQTESFHLVRAAGNLAVGVLSRASNHAAIVYGRT
jgi:hypothetical protein